MSKSNQKNQKFQEYLFEATQVKFSPTPTRGGRGYRLLGGLEIQDDDGETFVVDVTSGSPRFRPLPNVAYICNLKVRIPAQGGVARAKARAVPSHETLPLLSEDEWATDITRSNTVYLTFRKGNNGRPIAFFDGNPVFPQRGYEVMLGKSAKYLLIEKDGFRYHAVPTTETQRGAKKKPQGAVSIRVPRPKGATATKEEDLEYTTQVKTARELLGLGGVGDVTQKDVKASYERKLKALRLGNEKPFVLKRLSECFAEALNEARDLVLEEIGATTVGSDEVEVEK